MKYFKLINDKTYEWTNWSERKVKFKLDRSLKEKKIIIDTDNDSIIIKLNCICRDFENFKFLTSDLDTFCDQPSIFSTTPGKIAFPQRRFIRDLVDDAHEILTCNNLDRDEKIYLSMAFYYLILSKKSIFPEEYIGDYYCLMNFCRENVLGKFLNRENITPTDNYIPFVYLLCFYWKHTFIRYSMYFPRHDPEKEVWKIIAIDNVCGESDFHNSKPYQFLKSSFWQTNEELKNKFLIIIKDLIKWFGADRYNLSAMRKLIDIQKELDAESHKNKSKNKAGNRVGLYKEKIELCIKNYYYAIILIWFFIILIFGIFSQNVLSEELLSFTFFIIILCILWYFIKSLKDIYWFRKIVPRLFGAIIVGYIPLILQNNVWEFCLNVQWYVALQISFLSIFASWLFIFLKINKSVYNKKIAMKRANEVILLGIVESLLTGLVLCSLFSDMLAYEAIGTFFKMPRKINVPFLFNLFDLSYIHVVYPSILIVYSSLALFIGVFIQLFWEEKPITEEL